ncbi:MAG TPA: hypothetical protein PKM26_00420 [Syntrophorhabdaceae bacterium]|nr:hypothetical protein [Syntrophorhabdaceae bacterium]
MNCEPSRMFSAGKWCDKDDSNGIINPLAYAKATSCGRSTAF